MRFLLVDAANDEIINDFGNGTTFSLADLPEFNIVAEPETEGVQNVVFELNGSEFSVDNTAPYSLGGDNAGDFQALALEPGEYTLVATPFVLSANGDTVAQTPFDVTFSIVDEPNTESELNIEAEAEAEAESEAEAEVAEGIAAGAVAQGAGAAAFGNNALAETTTSGSISLDSRLPAPSLSLTGSETSAALLSDGDLLNAAPDIELSADVSVISAESEAEAETESEVEAEITNGAASATGGSAASAAAVGTNILLFEDGSSRPAAADTETATDSTTSTSTSVSPVLLAFVSEESDGTGGASTDETIIPTVLVDESVGESSETATVARVAKDKDKKDKFKKDKDKTLPVLVLDTEAEVEAEAEAEAEAESGAVTNTLTAAVVTAPGAAAAAVSGGTAVAVAGDFAVANAGSSVATSTSTSAVTEADFNLFSLEDPIVSEFFDDEQVNSEPESSESVVDIEGVAAKSSADKGKDKKDKDKKDKDNNIFGKGLFEAESEAEAEAEVEAEVGNNSAAVASIANGGGGAAGLAATSQISSSSTASTSTEFDRGSQIRDNDVVDRDRNRFEGAVDFADNSIAEVETEAQAQASISEDKIPLTSATANNFTLGDATAESTTTLEGSSSSIVGGETLGVTSIPEGTSSKDKSKDKKDKSKDKNKSGATSGDGVVGEPGNLEIEIESEVDAEAEAEISFNAAAAGASAVATQAENGLLPTPAEGTTATSSSTSVFNNGENRFDDKNAPGAAAAGERGEIPVPNVDPADLVLEIETEAEAEAEVGYNAGAAAAAASGTGREGLFTDTEIITTPFAAAAASGVAPVVEFEIFAPPEGEAGEVFARARAFDPEGGPVSVAVAVAGVPTESGFDNEEEAELEGLGEAIVEVSVFTDPADALNITPLPDIESLASESEAEADSEAEAEAGYGVAAAAASAGSAGLFSDASAKSSTSTLPIILADSGETILGTSDTDELLGTDRGDFIAGLEGDDKLTGNGGDDLFVYDRLEDGLDTITDFEVGSDQIVLTNLLARFNVASPDPIADGFIELSDQKKGSLVSIDTDGSGETLAQSLVLVENVSVDELSNLTNFAV